MADADQHALLANEEAPSLQKVMDVVVAVLCSHEQPSAWEIVNIIEANLAGKLVGLSKRRSSN